MGGWSKSGGLDLPTNRWIPAYATELNTLSHVSGCGLEAIPLAVEWCLTRATHITSFHTGQPILDGDLFDITSPNESARPSMEIIKLQWDLIRMAALSGAAEELDDEYDDEDDEEEEEAMEEEETVMECRVGQWSKAP